MRKQNTLHFEDAFVACDMFSDFEKAVKSAISSTQFQTSEKCMRRQWEINSKETISKAQFPLIL